MLMSLVLGIPYAISIDSKHGFSLWEAGGVVDFTYSRLSSAFAKIQP